MAFRIEGSESVAHAIRRLARKQLRNAVAALNETKHPLTSRVHDVRTSIKKVRALTALARPATGRRARTADRRLQRAAALTSALRDAEVLLETFDSLLPALASESESKSLQRARSALVVRLGDIARSFEIERRIDELEARLRRARRETKRWVPRKSGWRAAREGLVRGYRDARHAMACAYQEDSGRVFHEWRKTVKAHRHRLQLFHDIWPGDPALIEALDQLGELLGGEHDLGVLEQTVGTDRLVFPEERDRARLMVLIEQRRGVLRARAHPLGERLFMERPRVFRRLLKKELHAGQDDSNRAPSASESAAPRPRPKPGSPSRRHHLKAV
jgi:CHAD domain-containing protein